ncbi:MAG: 3-ketoacyl-ACP reductase [Rhodothermales bacterium]|nr:3-ketoacyl-ACP reductase [Rhodothermales bacterium]
MNTPSSPVALVTGGASGIGLGIARCLARDGFALALCGRRDESSVADALAELRQTTDVLYVQADVSNLGDHARLVEAVVERFGRLDVLVNNAGIAPKERRDLLDATPESFDHVLGVNLRGPYFLTQAVARHFAATPADGHRCIVFVTSISATVASINRGEYCISKAGLAMASRLWAVRLAEIGVPVYEVRPGVIASDMTAGVKEKYDAMIADGLMLQPRWGTPNDVGRAVAVLARGDLPYSTGAVVMVDGGLTTERL